MKAMGDSSKKKFASEHLDERIREPGDWPGHTLERVRELIHEEDSEIDEDAFQDLVGRRWR